MTQPAIVARIRAARGLTHDAKLGAVLADAAMMLEIQADQIAALRRDLAELDSRTPTGLEERGA